MLRIPQLFRRRPSAHSPDDAFDSFSRALAEGRSPGEELFANALRAGLAPSTRNRFGESLIEAAARLGSEGACLAMLRHGADPFEPSRCRDERGQLARLRPFEAFVAHDMPMCLHAAARMIPPHELAAQQQAWRSAQPDIHPQLRLWRLGSGWMHLAAASGSLRSLRALAALGVECSPRDCTGSGPLMAAARSRGSTAACAEALMSMGADPWEPNAEGERPADFMPPGWLALGAYEEARQIAMHCPASERTSGGSRSL